MISRRNFCKTCLATVGAVAVGGMDLLGMANRPNTQSTQNTTNSTAYRPRYLELERSGELERRERILWQRMESCDICPRMCNVNRMAGNKGVCSSDNTLVVSSHGPHFGEERPLVGRRGSGTIFFANCNLLCVFCINWETAHHGVGRPTTHEQLADMMISLQNRGCHNINLVTPSHILPHIITGLRMAIDKGLNLPVLYNSSGYEALEIIQLLDGIVDVYLPDFKYQDSEVGARLSPGAVNYPEYARNALKEMHRQVGTLQVVDGIAQRGLLIRHLVMPENLAGTDVFVKWVASELGTDTHVNIMSQYTPVFQAFQHPPIDRRLHRQEFDQAMRWAREAGLHNFH